MEYSLVALDSPNGGSGDHHQDIDLDRDEFLMLKRCLAIFRGHVKDKYIHAADLERLPQVEWDVEWDSDNTVVPDYNRQALERLAANSWPLTPAVMPLSKPSLTDWSCYLAPAD